MKQTFKALFMGGVVFFLSTFLNLKLSAQDYIPTELIGTWALDSVQVEEVLPDNIIQKTVLPGDDINFYNDWMWQMTFTTDRQLFYTYNNNQNISETLYTIKDKKENTATLIINRTVDHLILKIQLLSPTTILITREFTTTYNSTLNTETYWMMYYSKSSK